MWDTRIITDFQCWSLGLHYELKKQAQLRFICTVNEFFLERMASFMIFWLKIFNGYISIARADAISIVRAS